MQMNKATKAGFLPKETYPFSTFSGFCEESDETELLDSFGCLVVELGGIGGF
jgi:hypothetical protein